MLQKISAKISKINECTGTFIRYSRVNEQFHNALALPSWAYFLHQKSLLSRPCSPEKGGPYLESSILDARGCSPFPPIYAWVSSTSQSFKPGGYNSNPVLTMSSSKSVSHEGRGSGSWLRYLCPFLQFEYCHRMVMVA